MTPQTQSVRCCVVGGGPAGMMLGYLLARAGVETLVLEKHKDFLRDFRGDTVHPSTLELMHELGILDDFLKLPHQEVRQLKGLIGDIPITMADFSHLPTHCQFIALMPQWDFLNFLSEKASKYPAFHLKMQAQVTDLVEDNDRVRGVRGQSPDGPFEVRADLIIGADGRHSDIRARANFEIENLGAPMDVLWMRISRRAEDMEQTLGVFKSGKIMVMLMRQDYWQLGFVIPKGAFEDIRQRGLEFFREELATVAPFLRDRVQELREWKDIKLLSVAVDHLRRWHKPGLLCIGDAAHAMSPIGGVGINLAIQDAICAANFLARPLLENRVTENDLQKVQDRREFPARMTQRLQIFIQNRVIRRVLGSPSPAHLAWPIKLAQLWPFLQRIPARLVGMGFRPEHWVERL